MNIAKTACLVALTAFAGAPASPAGAQDLPDGFVVGRRCPDDGIRPLLQLTDDGVLHLVSFRGADEGGNLFHATSTDEGVTFGEAVRVNSEPDSVDASTGLRGAAFVLDDAGGAHVAWTGVATEGGEVPLRYTRRPAGADAFEPERHLSEGFDGLDVAPVLVFGRDRLFVIWSAPGESAAVASMHEPSRRLYLRVSTDAGESFSPGRAFDDERGVSAECTLAASMQRNGTLYVFYRTREQGDRELRLLRTDDNGATWISTYVDESKSRRSPLTTNAATTSPRGALIAFENLGKLYWCTIDKENGRPHTPSTPRKKECWRSRPAVVCSERRAVLMAWVEGPEKGVVERVHWQAFALLGRTKIGIGRFDEEPHPNTWPAVFERPSDNGFTVFY